MGRCAVAERIVHGREFGFYMLLIESHDLERLHHDLRIMITDSSRRKLNTVTYKVILISIDIKGILVHKCIHSALWHGERIVTEFQFSAFFPDLIHGEVYDPAKFITILLHMGFACRSEETAVNTCCLLGIQKLTCCHTHKIARF